MSFHFQKNIANCFLLFFSCVSAGTLTAAFPCHTYDSFYLGGTIGAASLIDKETTSNPIQDIHYLSSIGIIGGGLLGYDFSLNENFKLGLEGFANATNLNLSTHQNYTPTATYKVNMNYNTGLRLLPGYELSRNTIIHLILGYSYGHFKVNDNGDYGIINTQFSRNGFQSGLGLKLNICHNMLIRTDIIYTLYSSMTSTGLTTSVPITTQYYKNNLATLEANLALIYKFAN